MLMSHGAKYTKRIKTANFAAERSALLLLLVTFPDLYADVEIPESVSYFYSALPASVRVLLISHEGCHSISFTSNFTNILKFEVT
jgi:hypothetical protein